MELVSEDPIGFAAGDTNVARYVGNGVTGSVDPSGLQEPTLGGMIDYVFGDADPTDEEMKEFVTLYSEFGDSPITMEQMVEFDREAFDQSREESMAAPLQRGRDPNPPSLVRWYNPFTWIAIDWREAVDDELDLVQDLNQTFDTRHVRLDAFTEEERARIQEALDVEIDFDNGAIRASEGALEDRDSVYAVSEGALVVAGVADAGALAGVGLIAAGNAVVAAEATEAAAMANQMRLLPGLIQAAREAGNGPLAAQLAAQLAALEQGFMPK